MAVSPGVEFLIRSFLHLFLPSFLIYGTFTATCCVLAISAPQWALIILTVISRLVLLFLIPHLDDRKNARIAKAHGAILPPLIDVKTLEVPKKVVENFRNGYIGQ